MLSFLSWADRWLTTFICVILHSESRRIGFRCFRRYLQSHSHLIFTTINLMTQSWWEPDHCFSGSFKCSQLLLLLLLFCFLGNKDVCRLSPGQYEPCVTTPERVQNSPSAEGRNLWCWEESIKTGFAVVKGTERAWCLLATPPSSCDRRRRYCT